MQNKEITYFLFAKKFTPLAIAASGDVNILENCVAILDVIVSTPQESLELLFDFNEKPKQLVDSFIRRFLHEVGGKITDDQIQVFTLTSSSEISTIFESLVEEDFAAGTAMQAVTKIKQFLAEKFVEENMGQKPLYHADCGYVI